MAESVVVILKDGSERKFDSDRAGGSYQNTVRYEGVFVIVNDVWGNESAFYGPDVKEVKTHSPIGF